MSEHHTNGYPRLLRGNLPVASLGDEVRTGPRREPNARYRSRLAIPSTASSITDDSKEHMFLLRKIADTNLALYELAIGKQCVHEATRSSVLGEQNPNIHRALARAMPEAQHASAADESPAVHRCEVNEEQSSVAADHSQESQWHKPYGTKLAGVTSQNPLNDSPSHTDLHKNHVPTAETSQDNLATLQPDELVQDDVDLGLLFEQVPLKFPLQEGDHLTADEIKRYRDLKHRFLDDHARTTSLNEFHFSDNRYIIRLYPVRVDQDRSAHHDPVNFDNLAVLCDEVRASSWHSMFRDWDAVLTFMPLVQERLLCCTGDPEQRLDACWDRRPRGTFLDFGWTRENKDMPKAWSFFAYCQPEDLLTCLVEITDTTAELEYQLAGKWLYPRFQPWKLITVGQVPHGLYRKRILVGPQSPDKIKYMEHVLYVLASTELLNTFFKSERIDVQKLQSRLTQKRWLENPLPEIEPDDMDDVEEVRFLLSMPLSELAALALRPENNLLPYIPSRRADAEVFNPRHLGLNLLVGVGGLKVEWTEYLHEHMTLNTSTLTVYIFWFASHIRQNSMFHMYCDLFDCRADHAKIGHHSMSRTSMPYRKQILRSYSWIFRGLASSSSRGEAYYNLPLPWWLAPLQSVQQQGIPTKTPVKGFFARLGEILNALAMLSHFRKPRPQRPHGTIRSLLKDSTGRKCKLPIDCLVQLRPFNNERTEIAEGGRSNELYADDSDDEEESLGVTDQVSYELYPELAPRIKILIGHLEKQKPKGFIALWKDQRDSNTWYTFWAAVIFGVTALVLAAGSLAVSAAQTWATFRALDMQDQR